ncbi:MAG: DNA polymerase III subunit delta [Candidatus Peregrinibacteria bacterium]|nr:DNA polymerase III subunit delta [Candidatus Peregrinibacteria bacterium]MDZ4245070.1 DNA polymerase III subunit delta [Candidatus Gracilibacteria bacterium]
MNNIILFYGENTYLINEKLKLWEREFVKKHGDLNLLKLDGSITYTKDIYEQTNQMPFLSEKKLVIVKGFLQKKADDQETPANNQKALADDQKALIDYLEKIADFTILVFVETQSPDKRLSLFKHLIKNYRAEEFKNLEGFLLHNWIIKIVKNSGSEITLQNAKYLTEVCGNNMVELACELEKLSLNRLHQQIRKEDIDLITVPKLAHNIFKLTDAIAAKNVKTAIEILEEMKNFNEAMPMIFHMIVRQFRIIIQIKDCMDKGMQQADVRREVPEHPFVITNGMKQAANFSMKQLKKIYSALLDIEKSFKSGGIKISVNDHSEFELALQKFVVTNC